MTIAHRKAGPELDALIAERVMGWTRTPGNWRGILWSTPRQSSGSEVASADTFKPSTEIASAWLVVEKLRADGRKVSFETCFAGGRLHNDVIVSANFNDLEQHGEADAETMPLAICLAALNLMGRQVHGATP